MAQHNSGERVNFFRSASVPGAELLIANNSTRMWRVFHETYTLCSCAQAAASWRYGVNDLFVGDHGSMLMEPGETHFNTAVNKPADYKIIFIPPALVTDAARELGLASIPHLRCASSNDPKLFFTVYRFCGAVESGASVLEQQSLFTECVQMLLENTERRPQQPRGRNEHYAVARIKRYLQERFAEPVSLDELVTLTGLSRYHLVRTFTKHVGVAPHTYQILLRIARASTLLRVGVSPVCASNELGFADQSHFTRHFKRCWGVTPSNYQNATKR